MKKIIIAIIPEGRRVSLFPGIDSIQDVVGIEVALFHIMRVIAVIISSPHTFWRTLHNFIDLILLGHAVR